jgi:peptide/nickel transport system permease protein
MSAQPVSLKTPVVIKPASLWALTLRRFLRHRMALVGTLMLITVILYVVIGSFVFSRNYSNDTDLQNDLVAPSAEHPFGTDEVGRDILSRTIYGGQVSLTIGVTSVLVSMTVGTLIGAVSGYYGGWIDALMMRITEAMLSVPLILVLLLLSKILNGNEGYQTGLRSAGLDPSVFTIVIIIGLTSWMTLARIVRSAFLTLKEQEFVVAAHALGIPNWRIMMRHILPNAVAPIVVSATLGIAGAILQESYISFLGLGVQTPTASWGNMLSRQRSEHPALRPLAVGVPRPAADADGVERQFRGRWSARRHRSTRR